jgi:endoglucanase
MEIRLLLFLLSVAGTLYSSPTSSPSPESAGPVTQHGRLRVAGTKIVGKDGAPVSLAGMSFGWSQWDAAPYYNASVVNWLKQDWKCGIVRAALGIAPTGYLSHPEENEARVCAVVDAAIAADLYVLIDWHDHHAHEHPKLAVEFFQRMARRYGRYPNVIYEIYNEPRDEVTWSRDVKPYAEQVVAAIRAIDPEGLIVVGSPRWSQDVDLVAQDPLLATNVAYTLHFYTGSHKAWLRDKARVAMSKGLALFVTEWGMCNADGGGAIDEASTREWLAFMREYQLSHCLWMISDKVETASVLRPGAARTGNWPEQELTAYGQKARAWIRAWSLPAGK